ncbi:acyltransferase [Pontibacter pamirensis]|uniref:acyltransferase n=1 Tax=Pontibacter pamirensis TaxID=2562824 RepID=UPI001389DA47|nr:DapH/DapD/GlmU-related protein [Pontibacter pamirensis]
MASLSYLWRKRASFSVNSVDFYRAWGKRFFSMPELFGRNSRRRKLAREGAVIHESAEIGEVTVAGKKNLLLVGPLSFLGQVYIALHDEVRIGERVCINDGVSILTASHNISDPGWSLIKSPILIEDYVWIGIGAIILPGVHLGRGAVVGAGAVVSKSVAPGTVVVGNPARPVSKKRCSNLNYNPCEFLAANRAWLRG